MSSHAVIDFIESKCVLPAKSGRLYKQKYQLLPWQKQFFETMYNPFGAVKVPNAFIMGAKKTGKTDIAMLAVVYRFFDPRRHGELHTVSAFSESQAYILFDSFVELVSLVPELAEQVSFREKRVTHLLNNNVLKVLTKSVSSSHGLFPNGIQIGDEIGVWDDKCFKQAEIIRKGMSLAEEPQQIFLGNVPEHADHTSLEVLKECEADKKNWQVKKFKANENYSWRNPKSWASANPFYSYSKTPQVKKFYESEFKNALKNKRSECEFKRLMLGLGTVMDSSRWIDVENLQVIKDEGKIQSLYKNENIVWSLGVDLSVQGTDSTAWVLCGMEAIEDDPLNDETQNVYLYGKIYWPNTEKHKASIKDKILEWEHGGFVTVQKEKSIRMQPIVDDIYKFVEKLPFKNDLTIVFDPSWAGAWYPSFENNFRIVETEYRPQTMSRVTRIFQRKNELKNIYLLYEDNPAIRWQASCGIVNELSRNYCLLSRMNKNRDLNIDFWVASLLAGTELIDVLPGGSAFVV